MKSDSWGSYGVCVVAVGLACFLGGLAVVAAVIGGV